MRQLRPLFNGLEYVALSLRPLASRALVRNCRACRFDRCVLAGMKAEAVKLPANVDRKWIAQLISSRVKEMSAGLNGLSEVKKGHG